jgi:hypothetical protein
VELTEGDSLNRVVTRFLSIGNSHCPRAALKNSKAILGKSIASCHEMFGARCMKSAYAFEKSVLVTRRINNAIAAASNVSSSDAIRRSMWLQTARKHLMRFLSEKIPNTWHL